jgi:hypothetical protein
VARAGEVARTVGVFAMASEEVKRFGGSYDPLDFDPLHPGAIAPFNFPLNLPPRSV